MQFHQHEDTFSVVRITGPGHNILQFRVAGPHARAIEPEITTLEASSGHEPVLDHALVKGHVVAGLARAAAEVKDMPSLVEIRYAATDTGPESVYDDLAYALGCHVGNFRRERSY